MSILIHKFIKGLTTFGIFKYILKLFKVVFGFFLNDEKFKKNLKTKNFPSLAKDENPHFVAS